MIDFYGSSITDILPDSIRDDPYVMAVGFAVSNAMKRIVEHAGRAGIYAVIDMLDEPAVDLLAVELRTKYYGQWMTLGEKRSAVKKTLLWYCRAGTLFTVGELTDFVFQDAEVEEWFQYGSGAYLFRLVVNVISQDVPLQVYTEFLKSLYEVKNTRSHLEAVIFRCHKEADVKAAAAGKVGNCIKVKARLAESIGAEPDGHAAAALRLSQNIRVHAGGSAAGGA